eukprot:21054-Heterococcus_DN1.PRE.3
MGQMLHALFVVPWSQKLGLRPRCKVFKRQGGACISMFACIGDRSKSKKILATVPDATCRVSL